MIRETKWTQNEPIEKLPGELFSHRADFTAWLDTGVTITACDIVIKDSDGVDTTSEMLVGDPSIVTPKVGFTLKAGTAGKEYSITFSLTLSNLDTPIAVKKLNVLDFSDNDE